MKKLLLSILCLTTLGTPAMAGLGSDIREFYDSDNKVIPANEVIYDYMNRCSLVAQDTNYSEFVRKYDACLQQFDYFRN